jgi:zinc protease
MPAAEIDLGLRLEADRMVNSVFDPEEVASERTVIISEREGNENEPLFRLGEAVQAAAFTVHPYHHEIIGDMADLHTIQRSDLYNHYQAYYRPNNAVVAVAGDFDCARMLQRLEELFGPIPAGPPPPRLDLPEPERTSEERLTVSGPGETAYIQNAYQAPAAQDPDFYAYTVLDSLLTGPTGLNMFGGGGVSNKTSRLYRALVEKELTVSVNGGMQATIDPYIYDITLTLRPGVKPETALDAMDAEIRRIQEEPVPPEEVARAIKQARALFAYGSENITNQAFWLGYSNMFADYEWFTSYVDRLAGVTPQEVQDAARKYLQPTRRVVGFYSPQNGSGEVSQ